MHEDKPLFIPLKTEYYEQFENGTKRFEMRKYGARWNETTLWINRDVILSKGYGKKHRMQGHITHLERMRAIAMPERYHKDIIACYGDLRVTIVCIHIELRKVEK